MSDAAGVTSAPPRIAAVLFDLDDTLCRSGFYFLRPVIARVLGATLSGELSPIGVVRVLQTFRRVREKLRRVADVPGLHRLQMEITAERLRIPLRLVESLIRPLIYENTYPGLAEWGERDVRSSLDALRKLPVKIGVLSDYPTRNKLNGMGILDVGWDVLLSSEEVDALKPNPQLFQRALERIGVEPAHALYVGDRPDIDIAGARAVGMRTCLMKSWRKFPGPEADFTVGSVGELVERVRRLRGG